jgi:two-component system response regulator DesR
MDCTTPRRSQSLLYASDVYSAPRSLWKIVAAKLHLSESTVRNYLSSAIGKTGTRNRMEAMREARQQGWL